MSLMCLQHIYNVFLMNEVALMNNVAASNKTIPLNSAEAAEGLFHLCGVETQ